MTSGEWSPSFASVDLSTLTCMADYLSGLPDIPFAYNSALAAARSLASLAESTRSTATNRRGIANDALITWEGDFRAEFIRRTDDEIAAGWR